MLIFGKKRYEAQSYPVDEVDPASVGARGAVPWVVLRLVVCGELAVCAGRQALLVENSGALVAAGNAAGFPAGAVGARGERGLSLGIAILSRS